MNVKSFVKWAGGKNQLLPEISHKYPIGMGKTITRYCEPFVGGGAVLFDVLSNYSMQEMLINDINAELINVYVQIKLHIDILVNDLQTLQGLFWSLGAEERKEYYHAKRDRFNYLKINGDESANIEKAVLFIFLNKTCFNGLFRVNQQGFFNVPMGTYKKPIICDADNLRNINVVLQKVAIKCGDYKDCLSFVDERTFVYIDPPYRPLTKTANFTSYAKTPFDDNEQIALKQFVDRLHFAGVKIVVSNSDPKNSDDQDDFFDDLYKAYRIARVSAKRMINCNGENRGDISELLISNY